MRIYILISMFVAVSLSTMTQLSAQVLTGKVVGADKEPLPFANVVLLKDSTFVNGVITDDSGLFIFDQPYTSANKIKISIAGYEDYIAMIEPTGDFGTIMLK